MSIEEINSLPVNREAWYNVIRHDTRRSAHRLPCHGLRSNHGIMPSNMIRAEVRIVCHIISRSDYGMA